jgi:hypothetical protein
MMYIVVQLRPSPMALTGAAVKFGIPFWPVTISIADPHMVRLKSEPDRSETFERKYYLWSVVVEAISLSVSSRAGP